MPSRDSRPNVGLKPTTPQNAAGRMTEPFVWLPTASGTTPAATAAAEPIDEPPGVRVVSQGLRVGPGWRNASSAVMVFPTITAPAARRLRTTAASVSGTRSRNRALPHSVGTPAVSKMSLTPTGTPESAPRSPATRSPVSMRSAASASKRANAWMRGSVSPYRAMQSATAERKPCSLTRAARRLLTGT